MALQEQWRQFAPGLQCRVLLRRRVGNRCSGRGGLGMTGHRHGGQQRGKAGGKDMHGHQGVSSFGVGAELIRAAIKSEEHTSELQSLMRSSYAVFCLKKKTKEHK